SRRRHTRSLRDWSSDVCSSDLRRQPHRGLGEQQMLAIGRALMSRPRLILLDEPSMGLAPVMVLRLFDLIRRVREEGYTILVVERSEERRVGRAGRVRGARW